MLLKECYYYGNAHEDRTGVGRKSLIVRQLRFNMDEGFPLVTTKKVSMEAITHELLWCIEGLSGTKYLTDKGVNRWELWTVKDNDLDEFLDKHLKEDVVNQRDAIKEELKGKVGTIGDIYGPNWRNAPQQYINPAWPSLPIEDIPKDKIDIFKGLYKSMSDEDKAEVEEDAFVSMMYNGSVDQLNNLVVNLRDRPYSSRHVISAWIPQLIPFEDMSPTDNVLLDRGALAPCHMMFQCFVTECKGKLELTLHVYIRSSDMPVGLPYNIAQYALLLHLLANSLGYKPKELIVTLGDAHIYLNQLETVEKQLLLSPKLLPKLAPLPKGKSIFDITAEDIKLNNYTHHPFLKYEVSK